MTEIQAGLGTATVIFTLVGDAKFKIFAWFY